MAGGFKEFVKATLSSLGKGDLATDANVSALESKYAGDYRTFLTKAYEANGMDPKTLTDDVFGKIAEKYGLSDAAASDAGTKPVSKPTTPSGVPAIDKNRLGDIQNALDSINSERRDKFANNTDTPEYLAESEAAFNNLAKEYDDIVAKYNDEVEAYNKSAKSTKDKKAHAPSFAESAVKESLGMGEVKNSPLSRDPKSNISEAEFNEDGEGASEQKASSVSKQDVEWYKTVVANPRSIDVTNREQVARFQDVQKRLTEERMGKPKFSDLDQAARGIDAADAFVAKQATISSAKDWWQAKDEKGVDLGYSYELATKMPARETVDKQYVDIAKAIMQRSKDVIDVTKNAKDRGVLGNLAIGTGASVVSGLKDYTTLFDQLKESKAITALTQKLERIQDGSHENITPGEAAVLQALQTSVEVSRVVDKELPEAYRIGQGVGGSLLFMTEFAATGGIANAVKTPVIRTLIGIGLGGKTKLAKLGAGVTLGLAQAGAQAAGMPTTWKETAKNVSNGQSFGAAFGNAFYDTVIESQSERLFMGKVPTVAGSTSYMDRIMRTVGNAMSGKKGVQGAALGWLEEYAEEKYAELMHGVKAIATGEDTFAELGKKFISPIENFRTAATVAVITGTMHAAKESERAYTGAVMNSRINRLSDGMDAPLKRRIDDLVANRDLRVDEVMQLAMREVTGAGAQVNSKQAAQVYLYTLAKLQKEAFDEVARSKAGVKFDVAQIGEQQFDVYVGDSALVVNELFTSEEEANNVALELLKKSTAPEGTFQANVKSVDGGFEVSITPTEKKGSRAVLDKLNSEISYQETDAEETGAVREGGLQEEGDQVSVGNLPSVDQQKEKVASLEEQIADVEQRRNDDLASVNEIMSLSISTGETTPVGWTNRPKRSEDIIEGASKEEVIGKINAKYDAMIEAIKQKEVVTPKTETGEKGQKDGGGQAKEKRLLVEGQQIVNEPTVVRDVMNRPATLTKFGETEMEPVQGNVYQDGQQVVFETAEGKVYELGNVDEISDTNLSEMGLVPEVVSLKVNPDGTFEYNGETLVPAAEHAPSSIRYGKNGAVTRVDMRTPDGSITRSLRGQDAVEAAYTILLDRPNLDQELETVTVSADGNTADVAGEQIDLTGNLNIQDETGGVQPVAEIQANPNPKKVGRERIREQVIASSKRLTEEQVDQQMAVLDAMFQAMRPDLSLDEAYDTYIGEVTSDITKFGGQISQGDQGAIMWKAGKAVIGIFKTANASTLLHEAGGHLGRVILAQKAANDSAFKKHYDNAAKWSGAKQNADGSYEWTVEAEEKFARSFEKYVRDGVLPENAPSGLKKAFDALSDMLRRVYVALRDINFNLSPEIREVFDAMLTGTGQQTVKPGEVTAPTEELAQPAFHGSPHRFDKFTTEKIGTGEGVQAFGWGLYFTDRKGIAEDYARRLSGNKFVVNGQTLTGEEFKKELDKYKELAPYIDSIENGWMDINDLHGMFKNKISKVEEIMYYNDIIDKYNSELFDVIFKIHQLGVPTGASSTEWSNFNKGNYAVKSEAYRHLQDKADNARNAKEYAEIQNEMSDIVNSHVELANKRVDLIRRIDSVANMRNSIQNSYGIEGTEQEIEDFNSALDYVTKNNIRVEKSKGNVYYVELHEGKAPDQYDYLLWHKDVTPEQIEKINNQAIVEFGPDNGFTEFYNARKSAGAGFPSVRGSEVYQQVLPNKLGWLKSDQDVSLFLLRAGIDGVQYPTQFLSKGNQNNDFNYVIFDESAVTIKQVVLYQKQIHNKKQLRYVLESGNFAMVTGENPDNVKQTDAVNKKLNAKAHKWLVGKDYVPIPITGHYSGNVENSFFVRDMKPNDVADFLDKFKQESAATHDKFVFRNGTYHERTGHSIDGKYEDDYSTIVLQGKPVDFAVDYDFSVLKQEEGSKKLKTNDARLTQDFFSKVAKGEAEEYKPTTEWKPVLDFTPKEQQFKRIYDNYEGNFDMHIATSIPTFRETQVKTGRAVTDIYKGKNAVVYDLGGSEGGWVKAITRASGGKIKSFNLDPNPAMEKIHNDSPVKGSAFVKEAFLEGWTEDDGTVVRAHNPKVKADVVHESMMFQFVTPEREQFVEEAKRYLKPNGIFVTEEKFQLPNREEYLANEAKKAKYKDLYFTKEQQEKKSDTVLVGMSKDQALVTDYEKLLAKNFAHVAQYWDSGNFKGYVASDSKSTVDTFLKEVGDTSSQFSTPGVLKQETSPRPSSVSEADRAHLKRMQQNDVESRVVAGRTVSTRTPSGKNAPSDVHSSDNYEISMEEYRKAPKQYLENAVKIAAYPMVSGKVTKKDLAAISNAIENTGVRGDKKILDKGMKAADVIYENMIEVATDNILWLHDKMDPDLREVAKRWYDGANIIAQDIAKKYGVTNEQVAAVIAAHSPKRDWFSNVSAAERSIDIYMTKMDYPITQAMIDSWVEVLARSPQGKNETEEEWKDRVNTNVTAAKKDGANLLGRKIKEAESLGVLAPMIRAYNDTNNSPEYTLYSPNGENLGFVKNTDGSLSSFGFANYSFIDKTVSILRDGSPENISYNLGTAHKIRNFNNNIIDPMSKKGYLTSDTHAVAASHYRNFSQLDVPVTQSFGSGRSAETGITGTYPVYDEAYRRAAESRGILKRQMQSIVWEAVRGLFEAKKKSDKGEAGLKAKIDATWNDYAQNKITANEARERIDTIAEGISTPSWARSNTKEAGAFGAANQSAQLQQTGGAGVGGANVSRRGGGFDADLDEVSTVLKQEASRGFTEREKPDPKKTVTAYKLFRIDPKRPGQLFPLFVDAKSPVPVGPWLDAGIGEGYSFMASNGHWYIPATTGVDITIPDEATRQELLDRGIIKSASTKSVKAVARRPGWHAGDVPIATHIGGKTPGSKKVDYRPNDQVWAEVEMGADVNWQPEANRRGVNANGNLVVGDAHITDAIPEDGVYRYKTNPNMTGNWIIGGTMKVTRVLTDEEVRAINVANGVEDLPRTQPMDLEKAGFEMPSDGVVLKQRSTPIENNTVTIDRNRKTGKVTEEATAEEKEAMSAIILKVGETLSKAKKQVDRITDSILYASTFSNITTFEDFQKKIIADLAKKNVPATLKDAVASLIQIELAAKGASGKPLIGNDQLKKSRMTSLLSDIKYAKTVRSTLLSMQKAIQLLNEMQQERQMQGLRGLVAKISKNLKGKKDKYSVLANDVKRFSEIDPELIINSGDPKMIHDYFMTLSSLTRPEADVFGTPAEFHQLVQDLVALTKLEDIENMAETLNAGTQDRALKVADLMKAFGISSKLAEKYIDKAASQPTYRSATVAHLESMTADEIADEYGMTTMVNGVEVPDVDRAQELLDRIRDAKDTIRALQKSISQDSVLARQIATARLDAVQDMTLGQLERLAKTFSKYARGIPTNYLYEFVKKQLAKENAGFVSNMFLDALRDNPLKMARKIFSMIQPKWYDRLRGRHLDTWGEKIALTGKTSSYIDWKDPARVFDANVWYKLETAIGKAQGDVKRLSDKYNKALMALYHKLNPEQRKKVNYWYTFYRKQLELNGIGETGIEEYFKQSFDAYNAFDDTKASADRLTEVWADLNPYKITNPDGTISLDTDAMEKDMSPELRAVHEVIKEGMVELEGMSAFVQNVVRGGSLNNIPGYFPQRYNGTSDAQDVDDYLKKGFGVGSRASSTYERTKNKAIDFNAFGVYDRHINDVIRDFYLTPVIKEMKMFFEELRASIKTEGLTGRELLAAEKALQIINTLERTFLNTNENDAENRSVLLHYLLGFASRPDTFTSKLFHDTLRRYAESLISHFTKTIGETISNIPMGLQYMDEIAIGKRISNAPIPRGLTSAEIDELKLRRSGISLAEYVGSNAVNALSRFSDDMLTSEKNYAKAFNDRYDRYDTVLDFLEHNKLGDEVVRPMNNFLISTGDRVFVHPAWNGAFEKRFKEITGSYVDREAFDTDPEYRVKYDSALRAAGQAADRVRARISNPTSKIGASLSDATGRYGWHWYARMFNKLFYGFGSRESNTLRANLDVIMSGKPNVAEKKQALREIVNLYARNLLYQEIMAALYILFAGSDDDRDAWVDKLASVEYHARQFVAPLLTLGFGGLGNVAKIPIYYATEFVNKTLTEEFGHVYDPMNDSFVMAPTLLTPDARGIIATAIPGMGREIGKHYQYIAEDHDYTGEDYINVATMLGAMTRMVPTVKSFSLLANKAYNVFNPKPEVYAKEGKTAGEMLDVMRAGSKEEFDARKASALRRYVVAKYIQDREMVEYAKYFANRDNKQNDRLRMLDQIESRPADWDAFKHAMKINMNMSSGRRVEPYVLNVDISYDKSEGVKSHKIELIAEELLDAYVKYKKAK